MARRFTLEQKQRIVQLYDSGLSLEKVAKAFHSKSPHLFSSILREMGVEIRTSQTKRSPTVKEIYGERTLAIQKTWSEEDERHHRTGDRKFIPWTPLEVESPDTINRRAGTR